MVQPWGHGVCLFPPGELGAAQMFAKGGTCGPSPSQQSSGSSGPAEEIRTPPPTSCSGHKGRQRPGLWVPERAFAGRS